MAKHKPLHISMSLRLSYVILTSDLKSSVAPSIVKEFIGKTQQSVDNLINFRSQSSKFVKLGSFGN